MTLSGVGSEGENLVVDLAEERDSLRMSIRHQWRINPQNGYVPCNGVEEVADNLARRR